MMQTWQRPMISILTIALLTAGGCSKTKMTTDEALTAPPEQPQEVQKSPARTGITAEDLGMAPMDEPLETAMLSSRSRSHLILEGRTTAPLLPVYFDFDKTNIREDQQPRLEQNNAYFKENPGVTLRIEGNCDERGTSEYNMALGERRALNAKKYLVNLGMDAGRIDTLSYGEDKPLLHGHDELSWAQNRRDDFLIQD